MRIKKIVLSISIFVLTTLCAFSFMMYINFSRLLDLPKKVLKSGPFELSGETYDFTFTAPKEARYNVVLKFILQKDKDPITKYKAALTIISDMRDIDDNLLLHDSIDENSRIRESWSNEEFRRYVLSFNAKKKQTFKLRITFNSKGELLNRINKEIYIEKDFDPASYPWWGLFQRVFLGVFGITFLVIAGLVLLALKKKWKLSDYAIK